MAKNNNGTLFKLIKQNVEARGGGGAIRMTDNRGGGAGPSLGAFHACYLVGSLDPSMKGRSYVGFTVNPERRIRQHNGVLASGAKYTRRLRPCEMVLLVHGFPSKVQALQFEWAWQKPALSRAVRDAARRLKVSDRSSSLANKTRLVMAMLHVSPWRNLPLRVHFLNPTYAKLAKDKCDAPPEHVEISTGDMDALKRAVGGSFSDGKDLDDGEEEDFQGGGGHDDDSCAITLTETGGNESEVLSISAGTGAFGGGSHAIARPRCAACGEDGVGSAGKRVACPRCECLAHPRCMASHFFQNDRTNTSMPPLARTLIPARGPCPACGASLSWGAVVAAGRKRRGGSSRRIASGKPGRADSRIAADENEREPLVDIQASQAEVRAAEAARVGAWADGSCGLDDGLDDSSDDCGSKGLSPVREEAETVAVDAGSDFYEVDAPLAERLEKRRRTATSGGVIKISVSP